jgi:hypothetical protein
VRIADGTPEDHPNLLPLDASASPGVAPPTVRAPGADSPATAASQVVAARDTTGERLAQLATGEAAASAAMSSGMAADAARRDYLAAEILPSGSAYGEAMVLPDVVADWSKHTGGSDATDYDPTG